MKPATLAFALALACAGCAAPKAPEKVAGAASPAATVPAPHRPEATPKPAPSPGKSYAPPKSASAVKKEPAAAAPHLDLKGLEERLKETKAIGTFTKLSLKNEVDDLLEKFRAYYAGRLQTTLDQLRKPYEMLMMKVLTLLQDADPPLAGDIARSREAIWGILSDRSRFATI